MKAVELRNVILCGDVREQLRLIPDETVNCVVTSPPYWGLRDYGTASWEGGDPDHAHRGRDERQAAPGSAKQASSQGANYVYAGDCSCGAVRVDNQIGLEPTPEEYVCNMVDVFREVRRVLRKDGTLWLNLGDSYAGSGKGPSKPGGLKPKDLVGIPWSVAKALQAPYYTGRIKAERDRVWLAAMIDAEGTICGFDHDRADNGSHRSGVHITITNSSTALLDEAQRIWPTSRSEHDRPGAGHLGHRPTWRWLVHGIENKMTVLSELYPYLIVKRRQAMVAYSLLLLMKDAKRLGHSPQKDAVLAKRRILTGLLSDLNQGRVCVLPTWLTEPPSMYEPGWYLRSDVIWSKPNPMPESVTDRPTKAHEYVFLLSKSERYYYDADAIREPLTGGYTTAEEYIKRTNSKPHYEASNSDPKGGGFRGACGISRDTVTFNPAGRNRRTVWEIATKPYPEAHFATYPEDLVKPCILAGCPEGGIVLDPFLGSGTTASVAKTAGRDWIGIELNPTYVELAKARINVDQERLL